MGLGALAWVELLTSAASAKPWKGAELISRQTFEYGAFEARILAARGSGLITPFFLWKDGSEIAGVPWQEQDFEIFGRDGRYQTQLMTPGTGSAQRTEHVQYHSLPTPAWERYYTYRMEWTPERVAFYVDGQLVREETDRDEFAILLEPNRAEPAQLRLSLWAGDSNWSGSFDESAVPAAVFVNWVQVYSYTPGAGPGGSDFSTAWRDDFNSLDGQRWWTANWTFDYAVNDYVGQNVTTRDGKLVIVFTDENATGQFPSAPEDGVPGLPSPGLPSPGLPSPVGECSAVRQYTASELVASTGAASGDGWNLWSNGTLSHQHDFSAGAGRISVAARGQQAAGQWPHMSVLVGERLIGEATVASADYASYEFPLAANAATELVSVRFDNDYYQGGEDRNLFVQSVAVFACGN
ncbi:MAG: hypothetical protein RL033_1805 [Pseudomonadota bacterium]